jgi:hypothetical protein
MDVGSGWTEAELWLHLLEEGVGVRVQRNKMEPLNEAFQEWSEKASGGGVTFCHYSESQLLHPHLKKFSHL